MFPDMPTSKPLVSGYALVFGAMYLAGDDIATVILVHAAIDIASRIFASHPTTSSTPAIVAFIVLLAAEAAYALWLMRQAESSRAIR